MSQPFISLPSLPEIHGGLSEAELRAAGLDPASVLDFSISVNPFGPSPFVRTAINTVDPARYPDRETSELRLKLADLNSVAVENVLVGNGTAELIWLAALAFLRDRGSVLIVGPTFGEYYRASRALGASVSELRVAPPDFTLDLVRFIAAIESQRPAVTFLCNPNNPTGQWFTPEQVKSIAAACGNGLLILDEAYHSFVTLEPFGPPSLPNVILLRSMTKDFALAGLRLGYALGEARLLSTLRAFQPPWSVNSAAQAAGLAALSDPSYIYRTLKLTGEAARFLQRILSGLGMHVIRSDTHFCLVEVGDARQWRECLLKRGCVLRDCTSFGLPEYVRVSTRQFTDNARLLRAWAEFWPTCERSEHY